MKINQCSSCGGFCKKSGCERKNVEVQQRPWVGLTDEEILADGVLGYHFGKNGGAGPVTDTGKAIIDVVTAMLKEKNA